MDQPDLISAPKPSPSAERMAQIRLRVKAIDGALETKWGHIERLRIECDVLVEERRKLWSEYNLSPTAALVPIAEVAKRGRK